MRKISQPRLRLEEFECRLTPGVARAIGTLQIVDMTTTPKYEWASSATGNVAGNVIGTDNLRASIDVGYTLDGKDATANQKIGVTVKDEDVTWANAGPKRSISRSQFWVEIPKQSSFPVTVVVQFSGDTTNDNQKDGNGTAHYFSAVKGGQPEKTNEIDLTSVGAGGPNTGGNPPNNPLRNTSTNVAITELGMLQSPDLPVLATGGYYRLLTYDSLNGTDFTFTAANTSGYSLFTSSSPELVEDDEGQLVLDPNAALNAVWLDGSQTAGNYSGSNKDLVLRANAGGEPILLVADGYSAVPSALFSLADGQSTTVAAGDIEEGSDMLWLDYDDGSETHWFVLVPMTSSDPKLTVSDATVSEGNSGTINATFTVTLSAVSASNVTVQYATVSGTAAAGSDFTSTNGTLTFLPNETSKTVTVAVTGDTTYERDEDFFFTLSSATNAAIADGVGQGAVANDDSQPTISIDNVQALEGNSGTTIFVFTVTLGNPSWQTITLDFATQGGSATVGDDYAAASGTLTFNPGETTKTISITVYGDTVHEPGPARIGGENFFVNLSNAVNASIDISQGIGLIQDDD